MSQFDLITLTGADERTSVKQLEELVSGDARVEIGLLYTASPENRYRYPSRDWLASTAAALSGRCAIHICGGTARKQFLAGDLHDVVSHAARIQVNGVVQEEDAFALAQRTQGRNQELIFQLNAANRGLLANASISASFLVDSSGGRGLSPEHWVKPQTANRVGFAGGLGPDNLLAELTRIALVASPGAWVDMEGKLRRDDWFDINLARECVRLFNHARDTASRLRERLQRVGSADH